MLNQTRRQRALFVGNSQLILATLAQKWKLKLVPGHRVEPQPLITLRPKYGMVMKVEERVKPAP